MPIVGFESCRPASRMTSSSKSMVSPGAKLPAPPVLPVSPSPSVSASRVNFDDWAQAGRPLVSSRGAMIFFSSRESGIFLCFFSSAAISRAISARVSASSRSSSLSSSSSAAFDASAASSFSRRSSAAASLSSSSKAALPGSGAPSSSSSASSVSSAYLFSLFVPKELILVFDLIADEVFVFAPAHGSRLGHLLFVARLIRVLEERIPRALSRAPCRLRIRSPRRRERARARPPHPRGPGALLRERPRRHPRIRSNGCVRFPSRPEFPPPRPDVPSPSLRQG